jgi:hypothetical protein
MVLIMDLDLPLQSLLRGDVAGMRQLAEFVQQG